MNAGNVGVVAGISKATIGGPPGPPTRRIFRAGGFQGARDALADTDAHGGNGPLEASFLEFQRSGARDPGA